MDVTYTIPHRQRQIRNWTSAVLCVVVFVLAYFWARDYRNTRAVAQAAQAKAELAQAKADKEALRTELIVISSPYATMMCSEDGKIVQSNLAAELMLGWEHKDILGQSAIVLIPEGDRAAHMEGMKRSAEKIRSYDGNWMMLSKDQKLTALCKSGELLPVVASIRVIKFSGEIQFIVAMRPDAPIPPPIPPQKPVPIPELPANVSIERAIIQMAVEEAK